MTFAGCEKGKDINMSLSENQKFAKALDALKTGKSQYAWDELEELITDSYSDEKLTEEEFEDLMRQLMEISCE